MTKRWAARWALPNTVGAMTEFEFDPDTYMQLMAEEVPAYPRLQAAVSDACAGAPGPDVRRILDLGTGTGITARRVLDVQPDAQLVGVDESAVMLDRARTVLPDGVELVVQRLQDPLPGGPFDLVVSALAVHHLDGDEKAELFRRVAGRVRAGGRFVLGDLVVPDDPADVVTEIDGEFDTPSSAGDQLRWLTDAGFTATVTWSEKDLAVLVADRP